MNASDEHTTSLWMADGGIAPHVGRLTKDLSCDTVVVGAGIAGLSVAYELASAGQQVVVLDRGAIAGGMTARTTAHLAPVCDDGVAALSKMRGQTLAARFQESQASAVDLAVSNKRVPIGSRTDHAHSRLDRQRPLHLHGRQRSALNR